MKAVLPIIEQLVMDRLLSSKAPVSGTIKMAGIFLMICLFFSCAGLTALCYGLFFYLQTQMVSFEAAFMTGGALLAISFIAALSFNAYRIVKRREKEQKRQEMEELITVTIQAMRHDLSKTTQKHPETTLLLTALSGFIAGKTIL